MSAVVRVTGGRALRVAAAFVLLSTGLAVATQTSASATTTRVCAGRIGPVTVDRVEVPAGATCRLDGTVVRHNVKLDNGETLIAHGAHIRGNVQATKGPRRVRLIDTRVDGNIHVREAKGQVVIGNRGCRLDPVAGNNIHLKDNHGPIAICQMTIEGNLHLINNAGTVNVVDNRVGNNLHAKHNNGKFVRVRRNRIGTSGSGNLVVRENATRVIMRKNRSTNHTVCRDNRRIEGGGNRAAGGLRNQCTRLR